MSYVVVNFSFNTTCRNFTPPPCPSLSPLFFTTRKSVQSAKSKLERHSGRAAFYSPPLVGSCFKEPPSPCLFMVIKVAHVAIWLRVLNITRKKYPHFFPHFLQTFVRYKKAASPSLEPFCSFSPWGLTLLRCRFGGS